MASKPPSLAKVRERIDAIDTELLRLIDQRAALSREVAEAKAAAGEYGLNLRPSREAQILRRLVQSEHRQSASKGLVVALWRELMSDSLYAQSSFHVAVWGGKTPARTAELARMRFGSTPPLYMVDTPEQAIASAKASNGIAVCALSRDYAWWAKLLLEPKLSVFAVLPCVSQWGTTGALAIAEVTPEPSGEGDETLWVTDSVKPAYEIESLFMQDGVAARLLTDAGGIKLFALSGFYMRDDERLARGPGRLTGVIGVAPVSFDLL